MDDPRSEQAKDHAPSPFTCPECGGTLWERGGPVPGYECRVGHAYTEESFLDAHQSALEQAMWAAVVALEERADLSDRMGRRMHDRGNDKMADRFDRRATTARRHAVRVREALVTLDAELDG